MAELGEDIQKLGFGMMRLPRKGRQIDLEQAKQMVDLFLDAGFTYFDTAWSYPGSEEAVRQVLVERYPREKYLLATKNAAWQDCPTKEQARNQLQVSLQRTGAGYFDFYLLHSLGHGHTEIFDRYDMWHFGQQMKEQGLIRHFGFSAHTTPEELDQILTDHPEVEFVQLQINYADWENPSVQARRCYETVRRHQKPVIIMEPVKGGLLANPPSPVEKILQDADPNVSCASWAIRYAASLDGVITVLSGMSNLAQVQDNLSYMKDFQKITIDEQAVLRKAQDELNKIPLVPCTGCNYCAEVCPQQVGISQTMSALNFQALYGEEAAQHEMQMITEFGGQLPDQCIQCGQCETVCPQHLEIRKELEKAVQQLMRKKG